MSEIVHCPKCQSAVSVSADQAGNRVQCPSCSHPFLAPSSLGSGGGSAEDDDWLILDESPPPRPTPISSPVLEYPEDDPFEESPFLDSSFVEATEDETDPSDLFAGLPPIESSPAKTSYNPNQTSGPPPAVSGTWGPEEEFRVTCPICGSLMYVKAKQAGRMIKCSDCFTEIRVPNPPKKKTQLQPTEEAETFLLSEPGNAAGRREDPFKKNANELLREAARDPDEDRRESSSPSSDAPDMAGWFKSVFGIWLDPGVIIHFVALSLLLAFPAALTVAYPILALGMIPLGLLGMVLTTACGFAILMGVANEHERIEDWPTVDPAGWFESLLLVIVATAMAVGPSFAISTIFGAPPVIRIGLIMFTVYAAFPIILLSMLDMQSITSPFSADVSKSITRCQEEWGAFYFSAGLLFAGLFGYFAMCSYSPKSIAIGVVLSIAVVFMYFAILGRLALAIGEVVDLPGLEAEDKENDDANNEDDAS